MLSNINKTSAIRTEEDLIPYFTSLVSWFLYLDAFYKVQHCCKSPAD